jgi:DNA-directed RNA polymerase subunit beta
MPKKADVKSVATLSVQPEKVVGNRYFFTEKDEAVTLPPLIEIQHDSFNWFLQDGIKEILDEITPITDFSGKKMELHFLGHRYEKPKFTPAEARRKMTSYESNLVVRVRLVNKETGEIKEQEVFLGAIPMMTEKGTFIVNGNRACGRQSAREKPRSVFL